MNNRLWMTHLTDAQRRALQWKCIWCDHLSGSPVMTCIAPDGDGHMYDPVKPEYTTKVTP